MESDNTYDSAISSALKMTYLSKMKKPVPFATLLIGIEKEMPYAEAEIIVDIRNTVKI